MDIEKLAEEVYRQEPPRMFPYSPYGRQMELHDLWPTDRKAYVDRVARIVKEMQKSK